MKRKLNLLFIGIATIAVIAIVFATNDINQLYRTFLSTNKVWIFIAVSCMGIYCLLESGVLYCTANSIKKKLTFPKAFQTTMVGQLFNNLTPFASGGQPMQLYYLTQASFQIGEASSILLMKFIVYQSALIVYSTILIFIRFQFFSSQVNKLGYLIGLGFSVNVAVVTGLLLIGFLPIFTTKLVRGIITLLSKLHIFKNREASFEKAKKQIEEFHIGFRQLMKEKSVLIKSIVITVLQLTAFFFIPFCVCMALRIEISSIISVIAASSFVLMVSSFVPLPGASGGAEGSFYLLFSIFLISPTTTAVALLIWRFITYYLPIIVGIFFCRVKTVKSL